MEWKSNNANRQDEVREKKTLFRIEEVKTENRMPSSGLMEFYRN